MNLKLSYYLIPSDDIEISDKEVKQVLFATRTGSVITLDKRYIEMLNKKEFEKLPNKILKDLIEIQAIVSEEEDELLHVLTENEDAINSDSVLSLVIQPGASCQLGCHYCGQKHSNDYMDEGLIKNTVARIKHKIYTEYPKAMSVTWYGAEPLMGLRQIREMSPKILELADDNKIDYIAHMVTNGMSLKFDIYKELVDKYRIKSYQITLDGTAEYHDRNRFLKKDKGPSFDIIFNNIIKIATSDHYKKSGANITIRCNVDNNNVEGLPELIKALKDNNLQDKVGFYLVPVHKWGENDAEANTGVEKNSFAQQEIDWMISLIESGFEVDILPERKKIACSSVKKNSEVYDAYGTISSCWEVPYTEPYGNSKYEFGHVAFPVETEGVEIPMRNWNQDILNKDYGCKTCKLLPVCGGECPIHWETGTPACPSFKFNIKERLLLKYIAVNGGI